MADQAAINSQRLEVYHRGAQGIQGGTGGDGPET